ncbi:hypothetical protein KR067_004579 [Drosophila pandora]|nr:hypothetical protein KR067_004579 [Drosophila pandora]
MFSSNYTIVDILLSPSPNNRRECVAFVLFARESEAQSALEDTSKHYIGFRQLRVRPSSQAEMMNAKEKLRRANEQLLKEEADQREELLRDQQRRQQQMLQQQQQQEQEQERENNQESRYHNSDPRRRHAEEQNHHQQQVSMNHNQNMSSSMMQAFSNGGNNGVDLMAFNMPQQQQNGGNMYPFNMNNNNNGPMDNGSDGGGGNNGPQRPRQEDVFVRVHNCEYSTRLNELGKLFTAEQLRVEHIEPLFNDRNQSSGEFIVEFQDPASAKLAVREFHNRRFRGRGLRVVSITPQEIADKMNKPFMDYLPGGNGHRQMESNSGSSGNGNNGNSSSGGSGGAGQVSQGSRRRGPSRFDDISNRNTNHSQQPEKHSSPERRENSNGGSSNTPKQHFNPFARPDPSLSGNNSPPPNQKSSLGHGNLEPTPSSIISDKFSRPGCVVAMRNVPFKAELKDILRFFGDYKLSPDDIIRRFNDDGKPTGDTRVAFESPAEARSAYESRRRKQIFNRNVYLDLV